MIKYWRLRFLNVSKKLSLFVIGEEIKSLDKHTNRELLCCYPSIPWKDIMRMRDIIAHHYFEINEDVVFSALRNDVPLLMKTIHQIIEDLMTNDE